MLATPVYDSPSAGYTFAIHNSRQALADAGIQSAYLLLSGNCHVDDARNAIVRHFLASDCTDLVFLDADVFCQPRDLVRLCGYSRAIVGAVYPYRRFDVRQQDRGMPVRLERGAVPDDDGLLAAEGLPTRFMKIRRRVLDELAALAPTYRPKDEDGAIPLIFERAMVNGQRYGGDINFCRKWRELGGSVFADPEIRLGHVVTQVMHGSLGAMMRRRDGTTLRHVCDRIRHGEETVSDLIEAYEAVANPWGAEEDILAFATRLARQADGPIIEAGSGLTTVLMAAASRHPVYAIEHSPEWALRLEAMARAAGVASNIFLVEAPIKDGWYDPDEMDDMPERFALGVVDGPPRAGGDRMRFFDLMAPDCGAILADDADDALYADRLRAWAGVEGWRCDFPYGRVALLTRG